MVISWDEIESARHSNTKEKRMILVFSSNGREVKVGAHVTGHNRLSGKVTSLSQPQFIGSTGRVYVEDDEGGFIRGFFPAVIGAEWIETEEDV